MSTPYQRTRSLVQTKELLRALGDPASLPGIPDALRRQAAVLLQHFPTLAELQQVHDALPDLIGPPPPFSRLRGNPQTDSVIASVAECPGGEGGPSQ